MDSPRIKFEQGGNRVLHPGIWLFTGKRLGYGGIGNHGESCHAGAPDAFAVEEVFNCLPKWAALFYQCFKGFFVAKRF